MCVRSAGLCHTETEFQRRYTFTYRLSVRVTVSLTSYHSLFSCRPPRAPARRSAPVGVRIRSRNTCARPPQSTIVRNASDP